MVSTRRKPGCLRTVCLTVSISRATVGSSPLLITRSLITLIVFLPSIRLDLDVTGAFRFFFSTLLSVEDRS